MSRIRLAVVSDTHLAARAPEALRNWGAVVDHLNATVPPPDLVVHLGDLTMTGQQHPDELELADRELDRLAPPWRILPGNHDVGENHGVGKPDWALEATHVERWHSVFGPGHWSVELDGWAVIGLNAQVLGSGLSDETEQWHWLEAAIEQAAPRQIVLALHKPVDAPQPEPGELPSRFIPEPARRHLAQLFADRPLRVVLSGHVHEQRELQMDGCRHVWVPSTWAVIPDATQPPTGTKVCGFVWLELGDRGAVDVSLVRPDRLVQQIVGIDTADHYHLLGGTAGSLGQ